MVNFLWNYLWCIVITRLRPWRVSVIICLSPVVSSVTMICRPHVCVLWWQFVTILWLIQNGIDAQTEIINATPDIIHAVRVVRLRGENNNSPRSHDIPAKIRDDMLLNWLQHRTSSGVSVIVALESERAKFEIIPVQSNRYHKSLYKEIVGMENFLATHKIVGSPLKLVE